ncbi:Putative ribonuclease H protein At1g65750 [Linum perenne]
MSREASGLARQAHLIGWRPTEEECFTFNSNVSLYTNRNRAATGGVIPDDNGRFVSTFAANLDTCSIMREKLKTTLEGKKLAWDSGIRKLRVQPDSKAVVLMLTSPLCGSNHHESLIRQFAELSSRKWQISVHHIYREVNFAANYLANLGHSFDLGVHVFDSPDVTLQYWLNFDVLGVCSPRLVPNNM